MTRSTIERIADVLTAIERCQRYAASLESSDDNLAEMAADAVERNLQIIGEAVAQLPQAVTDADPEIEWPAIRGMRNILVHQYFGVDPAIVRDVITNHLGPLAVALSRHQAELTDAANRPTGRPAADLRSTKRTRPQNETSSDWHLA